MKVKFFKTVGDGALRTEQALHDESEEFHMSSAAIDECVYFKSAKTQYKIYSIIHDVENSITLIYLKQ